MPGKTFKSALTVVPPREAWSAIQDLRRRYDRHFRRWMPHISIIYPFYRESDVLCDEIEPVAATIQAFDVQLTRFCVFTHRDGMCTVWLAPEPPEPLIELHSAFRQVFPECDDLDSHHAGYTPHLSVGQARGSPARKRLLARLQDSWNPVRFRIDTICLLSRAEPPNDIFKPAKAFPLALRRRKTPQSSS